MISQEPSGNDIHSHRDTPDPLGSLDNTLQSKKTKTKKTPTNQKQKSFYTILIPKLGNA